MEIFVVIGRFLYRFTLAYGVIGLAGGAFLESLGIPTASAIIELTAGLLIINGRTTFLEALIISDAGLIAGSLVSFYLGRFGSQLFRRVHRGPNQPRDDSVARDWLKKYGDKAIFFGQLFGPARTWISYPAGALGMDVKKFTLYTALGGGIYCAAAIIASLVLTNLIRAGVAQIEVVTRLAAVLLPVWLIFLGLIMAVLLWRRLKARRARVRIDAVEPD